VLVDLSSLLCYTESEDGALHAVLEEVNSTSGRLAPELLARLIKSLDRHSAAVWPAWADDRTPLERALRAAVGAMATHSAAARATTAGSMQAVVDGMSFMAGLLAGALHNIRRPLICKPVPHWLMDACRESRARGGGGAGGGPAPAASPHSQAVEFDAAKLGEALAGLPVPLCKLVAPNGSLKAALLGAIRLPSLELLYFLACLCPVHLVRHAGLPASSSASASFHVLHGPWLARWVGLPDVQPLWSSALAATHGTFGVWHGTASDNGFSALCFGLRSMSGTRHSTSGAMYGDGIYCCEDPRVALKFAPKTGLSWAGAAETIGESGAVTLKAAGGSREGAHLIPASYRLVLAVDAICAPGTRLVLNGADVTASSSRPGGKGYDVPPASYAIIPHESCTWVRELHVHDEDAVALASAPARGTGACGGVLSWPLLLGGLAVAAAGVIAALAS
jgi:hypothetical protein